MSTQFCPKCGTLINDSIHFCPKCGTEINHTTAANQPQPNTAEKNDDIQRFWNSDFIQMVRRDYFQYSGRLNRQPYITRSIILLFIEAICYVILDSFPIDDNDILILPFLILFAILLLALVADLMLDIRRFHDLNLSGWLVLLTIIPAFTPFVYLYLFIAPGTKGDNKYGKDPLSLT